MNDCKVQPCGCEAVGFFMWGLYPNGHHNKAWLCEEHSSELWEKIKGVVTCGLMHFEAQETDYGDEP